MGQVGASEASPPLTRSPHIGGTTHRLTAPGQTEACRSTSRPGLGSNGKGHLALEVLFRLAVRDELLRVDVVGELLGVGDLRDEFAGRGLDL